MKRPCGPDIFSWEAKLPPPGGVSFEKTETRPFFVSGHYGISVEFSALPGLQINLGNIFSELGPSANTLADYSLFAAQESCMEIFIYCTIGKNFCQVVRPRCR